ncbi:MAG: dTDP-4-dehydrorhamnose reductase [Clostridiales bacterium]|nr:dTDP-4-dehydrorhamnose reductase [Clostridiales bacterium]
MKLFVTGVAGQLGYDVIMELVHRNQQGSPTFTCIASDLAPSWEAGSKDSLLSTVPYVALDITDACAVEAAILDAAPDAIVHCAAWTAVDLAEEDDKKELVTLVNAKGTQNIAEAVNKLEKIKPDGCKLMYISTDYVFPGDGTIPWLPDCKAYAPLNHYGTTKLLGEQAVSELLTRYFIVRIAWVFGKNGTNFIKTMLNVAKTHPTLKVVDDQIGTPTYTYDLAKLLCDMVVSDQYGYYHATNSELIPSNEEEESAGYSADGTKLGYISWYDFAKEIFRQASLLGRTEYAEENLTLFPVSTKDYGISKAARPNNSRLDKQKLKEHGFTPLPTWQDALKRYLNELEF